MVVNKISLIIDTISLADSLKFYINETGLFVFDTDFGMNQIRLKSNFDENIYFLIQEEESIGRATKDLFEIYIKDIEAQFSKFSSIEFTSGGRLISNKGQIFEYPIGKSFSIEDPSGNRIIIIESDYF